MSSTRTLIAATLDWQGIIVEIVYEPNWLNIANRDCDLPSAHLDIRSIKPERAPLPITETGYRSHFLHPDEIDEGAVRRTIKGLRYLWRKPLTGIIFREVDFVQAPPVSGGRHPPCRLALLPLQPQFS